ncbi:MAG: tRNA (adenosine(37)-N6)-threonylcarbamoyltransferase complex transferase subunit TsaD [Acidobacteriota bacterium]|jgi:N6-L-threonylcarbamoyladenine synthase|nr:tRNA (adenosine(37)-N6)-threonylcarbamoyltransferase complex transferase subunit TsaD [Acidobacteriota bacterium]
MLVMGFESSCDETAVALVERGDGRDRVVCERVKSQVDLHARFGGVVPEIASRTHYESIDLLTSTVLQETGTRIEDVNLLSVTTGPGLIGSLLIALSFAKGLAFRTGIPLAGVDHVAAHIEAAFIGHPEIEFPLLAMVVSGGHTTLFRLESRFELQPLASTRDDAAGEVMDKVARHLGLGYPGGPIMDQLFDPAREREFGFSVPRMSDGSADFSFSGYKAAALRLVRTHGIQPGDSRITGLVSSLLASMVDYLVQSLLDAVERHPVSGIVVAGGVSRNSLLRRRLAETFQKKEIPFFLPRPEFCTDNASMIAWLGYETFKAFPEADYSPGYLNAYSRSSFSRRGPR